MELNIYEISGWIGFILLLISYALLAVNIFKSSDFKYQFLNFLGAIFIIINAFYHNAYAPAILNVIWGLIALIGILSKEFKVIK
jgi:hypothetical protein